jgi:hypothetical protein
VSTPHRNYGARHFLPRHRVTQFLPPAPLGRRLLTLCPIRVIFVNRLVIVRASAANNAITVACGHLAPPTL